MVHEVGRVLRPALDRFAEKIALTDTGCIEWIAGTAGEGYGYFYAGRTTTDETGRVYAHRWSYEYHVGAIPSGLQIDHLCRNKACVNPDHLEAVSSEENLRRSDGNAKKTHCPAGHPYAGDNVYSPPVGGRQCRACKKRSLREFRIRTTGKAS